jgi:CubicO group peptidase (beta-lactamase class C family)
MAKIGLLLLHDGRDPSGHQIVSESWLRESITPQVTAVEDKSCTIKYGYFWWLGPACKTPWYAAMGNGGQLIWVSPSLDIVIVTTAGLYNSRVQSRVRDEVLNPLVDGLNQP